MLIYEEMGVCELYLLSTFVVGETYEGGRITQQGWYRGATLGNSQYSTTSPLYCQYYLLSDL